MKTIIQTSFNLLSFSKPPVISRIECLRKRLYDYSRDETEKALQEVRVLRDLRHDNIVGYITVWCEYPRSDWQNDQEKRLRIPSSQKVSAILLFFVCSATIQMQYSLIKNLNL